MKKLFALFLVTICAITISYSQDFDLNTLTIIRSKYVGPDGLQFYSNPVTQGYIELSHKSGLFLEFWYSTGFNTKWSTDWDDELDYTLGWRGKVLPFNLSASVAYFDNFKVWHCTYNDVVKTNIKVDITKKVNDWFQITPFVSYINFIVPNKETPFKGGNLYALGFIGEIGITKKLKITPLVQFLFDDGAFGAKSGFLFKHSSTVNWEIGKHFTWSVVEVTNYLPFGKRQMKNEFVFGTGLSWKLNVK